MIELWERRGAMLVCDTEGWALISPERVHKSQTKNETTGIYTTEDVDFVQLCNTIGISTEQALALSYDALKVFTVDTYPAF